jgi:small subunit ribosomal protein S33
MSAPRSAALRALALARARIFEVSPPSAVPGGERTGAKVLRPRLVGPSMLRYYPANLNLSSLSSVVPGLLAPGEKLLDPREAQRLEDVERRKGLGKGPPKKGECLGPSGGGGQGAWQGTGSGSTALEALRRVRRRSPSLALEERDAVPELARSGGFPLLPPSEVPADTHSAIAGQGRRAQMKGKKK